VLYRRRVIGQVVGQGTGRKPPERVDADLRRELEAVEGLLAPGPFLLGEQPFLCDFAVAAQLVYLSRPPRSKALMEGRTVVHAYLDRMRGLRRSGAASV
jgi:glutathione S-transferase